MAKQELMDPKQDQSKMDKLFAIVKEMGEKIGHLESENETLKRQNLEPKGKKFKIAGQSNQVESTWFEELARRNMEAENTKPLLVLVKENGFKEKVRIPGVNKDVSLVNTCPYCTSQKNESLLDLQPKANRFACRGCGKSWSAWNVGKPYSVELEADYDGHLGKKMESERARETA